jgi:hypothetical protein
VANVDSAEKRRWTREVLAETGIVLTDDEESRLEIADFGLGQLDRIGLQLLTYVNTSRVCAKEIVLQPRQICPEHRHPPVLTEDGKEETFRCRRGTVYLYVEGVAATAPRADLTEQERGKLLRLARGGPDAGTPAHDHAEHQALVPGRGRDRRRHGVLDPEHRRERHLHGSADRAPPVTGALHLGPRTRRLATGLGWPEGPALLADGSVCFVETYLSRVSRWSSTGVSSYAHTAGGPNACVVADDGSLVVCQNGGTTGPWRADVQVTPGLQVVAPDQGAVREWVTEVDGLPLNGPNDLVYGPDGTLYFTDPGEYRPEDPQPSRIFSLGSDGAGSLLVELDPPTFPNGIAVDAGGNLYWAESYTGLVKTLPAGGQVTTLGSCPVSGLSRTAWRSRRTGTCGSRPSTEGASTSWHPMATTEAICAAGASRRTACSRATA